MGDAFSVPFILSWFPPMTSAGSVMDVVFTYSNFVFLSPAQNNTDISQSVLPRRYRSGNQCCLGDVAFRILYMDFFNNPVFSLSIGL